MPQRVVDDLEAIEIDEQHRAPALVALRGLDRVLQQLGEQRAIRQARQLVVRREVLDARLGISSRRDVLDDGDVVQQRAIGSAPRRAVMRTQIGVPSFRR